MNAYIKNTLKQCATCLEYLQVQPDEKMILHEMLCKPWEVCVADIFSISNNMLLCIVYYYMKFSIVKKVDGLAANDLIKEAKMVFTECGLLKKKVPLQEQTSYQSTLNNFSGSWT